MTTTIDGVFVELTGSLVRSGISAASLAKLSDDQSENTHRAIARLSRRPPGSAGTRSTPPESPPVPARCAPGNTSGSGTNPTECCTATSNWTRRTAPISKTSCCRSPAPAPADRGSWRRVRRNARNASSTTPRSTDQIAAEALIEVIKVAAADPRHSLRPYPPLREARCHCDRRSGTDTLAWHLGPPGSDRRIHRRIPGRDPDDHDRPVDLQRRLYPGVVQSRRHRARRRAGAATLYGGAARGPGASGRRVQMAGRSPATVIFRSPSPPRLERRWRPHESRRRHPALRPRPPATAQRRVGDHSMRHRLLAHPAGRRRCVPNPHPIGHEVTAEVTVAPTILLLKPVCESLLSTGSSDGSVHLSERHPRTLRTTRDQSNSGSVPLSGTSDGDAVI